MSDGRSLLARLLALPEGDPRRASAERGLRELERGRAKVEAIAGKIDGGGEGDGDARRADGRTFPPSGDGPGVASSPVLPPPSDRPPLPPSSPRTSTGGGEPPRGFALGAFSGKPTGDHPPAPRNAGGRRGRRAERPAGSAGVAVRATSDDGLAFASKAERDLDAMLRGTHPGVEVVPHPRFPLWLLARRGERVPTYTPDFLLLWRTADGLLPRVEAHELKARHVEADSRDAVIRMAAFRVCYPSIPLTVWRNVGVGKFTKES